MTEFDDLGDAEKVKFVEAELAATLNKLDDMIAKLTGLRTEVEDPDGLVRFTLGDDGRLLSLFIDDAVRTSLNNLGPGEEAQRPASPPATRQCGCRASSSGKVWGRGSRGSRVNWFPVSRTSITAVQSLF